MPILGEPKAIQIGELAYTIRYLHGPDLTNGYVQTLESLAPVEITGRDVQKVFQEMLRNSHVFVAATDRQIIGTLTLLIEQKMIHGGGKAGRIEDVAVCRGFQLRGVGRSLIQYAMGQAKLAGCYKVTLSCNAHNQPFYEKLGFIAHEIEMRHNLVTAAVTAIG
jgi:glucosamine-phosphate N-acetyltransferase